MANNKPPTPPGIGKPFGEDERLEEANAALRESAEQIDPPDPPAIDVLAAPDDTSPSKDQMGSQDTGESSKGDDEESKQQEPSREIISALQEISAKLDILNAINSDMSTEGVLIRFP